MICDEENDIWLRHVVMIKINYKSEEGTKMKL